MKKKIVIVGLSLLLMILAVLTVMASGDVATNQAPRYDQTVFADADYPYQMVLQGMASEITLSATDPDGDAVTYSIYRNPEKGTVNLNPVTGRVFYSAPDDWAGSEYYVVRASDKKGGVSYQAVRVDVLRKQLIRVVCTGTALTAGHSLEYSYPEMMDSVLGAKYYVANYADATTSVLFGDSYDFSKSYANSLVPDAYADIIVVDCGDGDLAEGKEETRASYKTLLESYLALPTTPRVLLVSEPEGDAGYAKALADEVGCEFVDITGLGLTRAALATENGALKLAETISEAIKSVSTRSSGMGSEGVSDYMMSDLNSAYAIMWDPETLQKKAEGQTGLVTEVEDDSWRILYTDDPNKIICFFHLTGDASISLDHYKYVKIAYQANTPDDIGFKLYYHTTESDQSGEKIFLDERPIDNYFYREEGGRETLILDMSDNPGWAGYLQHLRLDPGYGLVDGDSLDIQYIAFFQDLEECNAFDGTLREEEPEEEEDESQGNIYGYTPKTFDTMKVGAWFWAGFQYRTVAYTDALFESYADRQPIWGWTDRSLDMMAYQIDLAYENNIGFFGFDWFYDEGTGRLDEANCVVDMFMACPNSYKMEFSLYITNSPTEPIYYEKWDDFCNTLLPIITDERFLKVDNKAVLVFASPYHLEETLGSSEKVKECFDRFRLLAIENGLDGLVILGSACPYGTPVSSAIDFNYNNWNERLWKVYLNKRIEEGYDGFTAYNYRQFINYDKNGQVDYDVPYTTQASQHELCWTKFEDYTSLPYAPIMLGGWDAGPIEVVWEGNSTGTRSCAAVNKTPKALYDHVTEAGQWMKENSNQIGIAFLYAWNEYLEGGYMAPTLGDPDGKMLQAVGAAIAEANGLTFDGYRSWEKDYTEPAFAGITEKTKYSYEKENDKPSTDSDTEPNTGDAINGTDKPSVPELPKDKRSITAWLLLIPVVVMAAVVVWIVLKKKK